MQEIITACAKINLGLNVVSRRSDGYHNIETVFFPIPLYDRIEINEPTKTQTDACELTVTGNIIDCDPKTNLVVKAYNLLSEMFPLPRVSIHLDKHIPSQAGLGGGSSDAAYTIRALAERFDLRLDSTQMERYAARLGADCAFFIRSVTAYAEGIGDKLYHIPGLRRQLVGLRLAIVKPAINVSTHEAYATLHPHYPAYNCLETVMQPITTWRTRLVNDFEESVFARYPELLEIKRALYRLGAHYVSMSGSGSAMYAFLPLDTSLGKLQLRRLFPECYTNALSIKPET